eukprot:5192826-Prymnesium_polylepis.2
MSIPRALEWQKHCVHRIVEAEAVSDRNVEHGFGRLEEGTESQAESRDNCLGHRGTPAVRAVRRSAAALHMMIIGSLSDDEPMDKHKVITRGHLHGTVNREADVTDKRTSTDTWLPYRVGLSTA